jgi:beta-glucosidase
MDNEGVTRRALAPLLAGAALATTAACGPQGTRGEQPASRKFPADFQWGAATSAFQIEGSLDADGRGPSIWDVFQKNPANIIDHSTADVACDSYRRYADDVALLADANMSAYRFSISWSRVLPDGAGVVNDKGLDYYSRLTDALLEKKILPYATLFHWDLPQALYLKGGWANRDTAKRLADYSVLIADKLGDRIKNFIILNEAAVHTVVGHLLGTQAPGLKDANLLGPVTHHQNLGQGMAIQAMRAHRKDLHIGTTMALMPVRSAGPWWDLKDLLPAKAFDAVWNGAYLDPLLKGSYPFAARSFVDPVVKDGDMAITKQPIDFLGVNYYSPSYIKFDKTNPSYIGPALPPKGVPLDAFGREIDASGLGEVLTRLRDDYGNPTLFITENGCSDPLSKEDAATDDAFRIDYLRRHLEVVKLSMERGSPIRGYFVWTMVDNWEWDSGYTAKFGMVAMNRTNDARATKASYAWMKALAKSGLLAPEERTA